MADVCYITLNNRMFVCFDCGNGFGRHDEFLEHSCDADVSIFENNFDINDKEVTLIEKESYQQREDVTVTPKNNKHKEGGYIKCPLKCRKLFQKDQFMVPIALKEHVIKSHKSEENSELFQRIVNQAPSITLNCEVCGKLFTDYSSLMTHFNETHSKKVEMVPCQKCDKVKCQSDHLECKICGKQFNTHTSRKSHMERFHSQRRNRHKRKEMLSITENWTLSNCGLGLISTIQETQNDMNNASEVTQVSDGTTEEGELVFWKGQENQIQAYGGQYLYVIPEQ